MTARRAANNETQAPAAARLRLWQRRHRHRHMPHLRCVYAIGMCLVRTGVNAIGMCLVCNYATAVSIYLIRSGAIAIDTCLARSGATAIGMCFVCNPRHGGGRPAARGGSQLLSPANCCASEPSPRTPPTRPIIRA